MILHSQGQGFACPFYLKKKEMKTVTIEVVKPFGRKIVGDKVVVSEDIAKNLEAKKLVKIVK